MNEFQIEIQFTRESYNSKTYLIYYVPPVIRYNIVSAASHINRFHYHMYCGMFTCPNQNSGIPNVLMIRLYYTSHSKKSYNFSVALILLENNCMFVLINSLLEKLWIFDGTNERKECNPGCI